MARHYSIYIHRNICKWILAGVLIIAILITFKKAGASSYFQIFLILGIIGSSIIKIIAPDDSANELTFLLGGALSASVMALIQYELGVSFFFVTSERIILAFLTCYIIICFITFLTARPIFGLSISSTLVIVLGTIDYYVYCFRGSEISPSDIHAITTALNVAEGYDFVVAPEIAVVWTAHIALVYCLTCIKAPKINRLDTLKIMIPSLVAFILIFLGTTEAMSSHRWGKEGSTYNTLVLNLALELKEGHVKKPNGYNVNELEKYVADFESEELEETPDIIVIMNESFADLRIFGEKFKTNKNATPFLDSMKENTIKGFAYASVFGGGTANSEYEFLTGNTMAFLPNGYIPYMQNITEKTFSIVSELKKNGYKCIALHPYMANGWNRINVYPDLGFDQQLFIEQFEDNEEKVRDFISDKALYRRILKILKQETGPSFCFAVTMQNHGGWTYDDYESIIKTKDLSQEYEDANQYLTLLNESDKAIEYLIDELSESDKKTVVLFFGDHLPNLQADFYSEIYSDDYIVTELNYNMERYKVPFFVWCNYDIEEQENETTSINYLSTYLFKAANMNTAANSVLKEISESIPVITTNAYYSIQNNCFVDLQDATGQEREKIELYKKLQYNKVFDIKHRMSIFER